MITCARCQAGNPQGASYCGACGHQLDAVCGRCGAANPDDNRFCHTCGAPLPAADPGPERAPAAGGRRVPIPPALEGERKVVTVLFADIQSSTQLIAWRDPEEAREILDPLLEQMMEAVHRYEGTVNQVLGDGIMAIFGAPLAHEDHAVRACYAALRMQDNVRRLASGIRVRVGLNSGEVVVRALEPDRPLDYSAVGSTTHVAARMEQLAEPGTVLVTAETRRLAGEFVRTASLGDVAIRGFAAPIPVYQLVGTARLRLRVGAAAGRGLTRLTGRRAELAALARALPDAAEHGRLAAVVGEAGIGKSRLVSEFTAGSHAAGWRVLVGSAHAHARATPYVPMVEILRDHFELDDAEPPDTVRERVAARLAAAAGTGLDDAGPALLALLDALPEDAPFRRLGPAERRRATIEAFTRVLVAESCARPLLVVLEDLHWLDPESQALLDALVAALPASRLRLLVTCRTEYAHGWTGRADVTLLRLEPLPAASAAELLADLLGEAPELAPLTRLLVERSDGNPFFLEEGVGALVDSGALVGSRGAYRLAGAVQSLHVPATVQALVGARIDRLPREERTLLQTAAVIGKDFGEAVLAATLDWPEARLRQALHHLEAAEFIYPSTLFPQVQYSFKHALTHEVAYGSLVHARRRERHAAVVFALERLRGDHTGEQAHVLAHHAVRGEVWDRAVLYLRRAGAHAFARSAHRLAASWFEQALEALGHLPTGRQTQELAIDLRLDLRYALSPLGQYARLLECLREAERIAQDLGDDRRSGRIASYLANYHQVMGDYGAAVVHGQRALEIAGRVEDLPTRAACGSYLSLAYQTLGDYRRGIELARANLALLSGGLEHERFGMALLPAVYTRTSLARCLAEVGEFAEAAAVAQRAIELAEEIDHVYSLMFGCLGLGVVRLRQGEAEASVALLERSLALSRRSDSPAMTALAAGFLGSAYVDAARAREALAVCEEAARQAAAAGLGDASLPRGVALLGAGAAQAGLGRLDEAADSARRALDAFARMKARGYEAWAHHLQATIAARAPGAKPSEVEDLYRRALAIAGDLGMRPLIGRCHLGLADVYAGQGAHDRARAARDRALDEFRTLGMTGLAAAAARGAGSP